jgi:F0F1-type ATP synthase assembly protein I
MTAHPRLDTVVDRPLIIFPDHVEVVAVSDDPSDRSAFAMFGALTGIATLSAALVVGGAGFGLLVDDKTGSAPVFVFLGLVLGTLAAFLATRSIIRRFFR